MDPPKKKWGYISCQIIAVSITNFFVYVGAEQVIPVAYEITGVVQSVNGSCTTDVMCPAAVDTNGDPTTSHLLDGESPNINTSNPNWASQLVTVKKNEKNDIVPVDHVILTFSFSTPQRFRLIEIDMFLCLSWNTGAAAIFVFGGNQTDFRISQGEADYVSSHQLTDCLVACDSLTTVSLVLEDEPHSFLIWHILLQNDEIHISPEWVHVAEVRFMTITGERKLCTHPIGESHNCRSKNICRIGRAKIIETIMVQYATKARG